PATVLLATPATVLPAEMFVSNENHPSMILNNVLGYAASSSSSSPTQPSSLSSSGVAGILPTPTLTLNTLTSAPTLLPTSSSPPAFSPTFPTTTTSTSFTLPHSPTPVPLTPTPMLSNPTDLTQAI